MSVSLEEASLSPESENYSSDNEDASKTSPEELLIKPLRSDEVSLRVTFYSCLFIIYLKKLQKYFFHILCCRPVYMYFTT